MKLLKMETNSSEPLEALWAVLDIHPEDIPAPSDHFFQVAGSLGGLSDVNSMTRDEYTRHLGNWFRSPGMPGTDHANPPA
jgi:hypothetical protein